MRSPRLWRSFAQPRCPGDREDTRRDWGRKLVVARPYGLHGGDLLDELDFLEVREESTERSTVVYQVLDERRMGTYSFSFSVLFTPILFQNSSNVPSSLLCSLIRPYQLAPSFGPLARYNVFTVFFS